MTNARRSLATLVVSVAVATAAGGCRSSSSPTVVEVSISVSAALLPSGIDDVHAVLSAAGRADLAKDLPAQPSQIWEVTVTSAPAAFDALVTVTGRKSTDGGSSDVVTSSAHVAVVPGKSAGVSITLGETGTTDGGARDAASDAPPDGGGDGPDGMPGDGGTDGAKLAPGDLCATTSQCASGVCSSVDHVCCDMDCAGVCESCLGSKTNKSNGVCSPIPNGSNADSDCTPGTTTCGATGFCDGNRKCALATSGTSCPGTSSCSAGQLKVTPAACDGAGACVPGTATTAPCPGGVACQSGTACLPSSCTTDNACATGSFCDLTSNTCSPKRALAAGCSTGNQCTSGFCADGVCCTNGCAGTCEACLMTKTGVVDGHCAAVTANTDPDNECTADGTACGHTGLCDHNGGSGLGGCAFVAQGTTCAGTFSCSGSSGVTSTTTGSCNGTGTCSQSSAKAGTCSGFVCASGSACATTCTAAAGCTTGFSCSGGTSCVANAFINGPCVMTPDLTTAQVLGRGKDNQIHQKANGGTGFGAWVTLSLDASGLDTRSDLDCSANTNVSHIVATGLSPLGAYLHATGSGTTYNAFLREFPSETFTPPGASIQAYPSGNNFLMAALDAIPVYDDDQGGTLVSLNPISTMNDVFNSTVDIAQQAGGGGALRLVVGFDTSGILSVYGNFISSAPAMWVAPVPLSPPSGTTYAFSPTICVDPGAMGGTAIHVAAVAGGQLYHTQTTFFSPPNFSAWERINTEAAAAPDCVIMGDSSAHVVTLSNAGHVLDVHGTTGSWTVTDLGTY